MSPTAPTSSTLAAAALGGLAFVDVTTRRVPRLAFGCLVSPVVAVLFIEAARTADGPLAGRAAGTTCVTFVALGVAWCASPTSIGFGDVKVSAFTLGSAAAVSWETVPRVMVATTAVAVVVVLWFKLRPVRAAEWDGTIPFVPALCVGFVAGLGGT